MAQLAGMQLAEHIHDTNNLPKNPSKDKSFWDSIFKNNLYYCLAYRIQYILKWLNAAV